MSKFLSKLKKISSMQSNGSKQIKSEESTPIREDNEKERVVAQQQAIGDRPDEQPDPGNTPDSSSLHPEQEDRQPDPGNTPASSPKRIKHLLSELKTKIEPLKPIVAAAIAYVREKPVHKRPSFWLGLSAFTFSSGAIALWVGLRQLESTLPPTAEIFTFVREGTLTIKAADDTILQQIGPATREKLKINQIPPQLVKAFIASEDRRFYKHGGIDYQGIIRATVSNLMARNVVQGASTITQQLARMVFLDQEASAKRKIREALLAGKIEREMTKEQILERYLNLVYLGSGAYGVADAAWVYFGKSLDNLTLQEMATIAGLPPAPTEYSPLVNPKVARERRNIVLREMLDAKFITAAEAAAASATELKLDPKLPKRLLLEAPYFTSYIQKELPKYVSKEALEIGGLTVETTLNRKWQKAGEKAVKDVVELDGASEGFDQAALVAIDPRDGEIKALVGGSNFGDSQFNRATQAQRQPGSTFKGFVYTAAIAAGFSPYDGYQDAPMSIDGYRPENYGKSYSGGWISMIDALAKSTNVIAVRVLAEVGFEPTIKLARDMGIKTELKPYYALALGAIEVNLLELTNGYGTLAALGNHVEAHGIRRILNGKGELLFDGNFQPKQVIDKGSAAIMTWMLEGVVQSGTGRPAYIGRPVAGKTGTSEEARDLWFIGYIPQMVTGIWLGNDDSYPTWGSSGTAASTWHEFMSKVVEGMPVEEFPEVPQLDGRQGSIKAKPVQASISYYEIAKPPQSPSYGYTADPGSYNTGNYDAGNTSGDYYQPSYPSTPENYDPQPVPENPVN